MFSGREKDSLSVDLVNSVDLLIDGPFIESMTDNERVLIGSKNKSLTFVTDRYKPYEGYFYNETAIEEVTAEDCIFINGD